MWRIMFRSDIYIMFLLHQITNKTNVSGFFCFFSPFQSLSMMPWGSQWWQRPLWCNSCSARPGSTAASAARKQSGYWPEMVTSWCENLGPRLDSMSSRDSKAVRPNTCYWSTQKEWWVGVGGEKGRKLSPKNLSIKFFFFFFLFQVKDIYKVQET